MLRFGDEPGLEDDMGRWAHEWDVVGEDGRIRFVECDESGAPADRRRYDGLRQAEARGELVYRGIIRRDDLADTPGSGEAGPDRSYRQTVLDGAAVSGLSLGGDMALYRDS